QSHALPADEQEKEVVGEDQDEHRGDEEVQVGEEARHVGVVRHVADRVTVDQEPDAGHHQHHHGAQGIEPEGDVDGEPPHPDPLVDHVVQRALRGERVEAQHRQDAHDEGREDRARTDELRRRREPPPEEQIPQEAERREEHDPAQRIAGDDVHHRSTVTSSALMVSRMRYSCSMIASPTAASAAATAMTKNTITWPSRERRLRASATKLRLTAFSRSSTAMKITMRLRRVSTPTVPMANRMALSARYHEVGVAPTLTPSSCRPRRLPRWRPGGAAR